MACQYPVRDRTVTNAVIPHLSRIRRLLDGGLKEVRVGRDAKRSLHVGLSVFDTIPTRGRVGVV